KPVAHHDQRRVQCRAYLVDCAKNKLLQLLPVDFDGLLDHAPFIPPRVDWRELAGSLIRRLMIFLEPRTTTTRPSFPRRAQSRPRPCQCPTGAAGRAARVV